MGVVIIGLGILLAGCGSEAKLTVKPIKSVEKIVQFGAEKTDIYCPTGICQFSMSSNTSSKVTVNMFYSADKPFTKIEGVSVTGEQKSPVKMLSTHSFSLDLSSKSHDLSVQVVDYYR